jgi:hypothetical protein
MAGWWGQALCSVFRPHDASTSCRVFRQPAVMQTYFLQQIQGGQQIEFLENEIEPSNRASQPRVFSSNSTIKIPICWPPTRMAPA